MDDLWPYVLVAALVVLMATAAWFSWTATRLDRLHLRREAAESALRLQLARRVAAAVDVAGSGVLDAASAVLVLGSAQRVRDLDDQAPSSLERWRAESELTEVLVAVEPQPVEAADADAWGELRASSERVALARRIHNDVTTSVLALRGRRRVRWFGLAGHAERPAMVELDDRVPAGA